MQQKSVLILRKIFHLFVICLVVVTALTFVAIQNKKTNINSLNGNVKAGIHYIESKEQENPEKVYSELSSRQKKLEEELEFKEKNIRDAEIDNALERADGSIWNLFLNTAILGDSRVEAFANYAFLGSDYVFYNKGDTIRNIVDWQAELLELNPKHIVFSYGINDVGIGYWESGDDYAKEFKLILDELQKVLPETKFYISSIFVARDPAFERGPAWREIPSYNDSLKKIFEETDYVYIDNTEITETHANLYDPDGVHFYWEFYPYWAGNILKSLIW
ncbi:MAG: hypothetical protein GX145_01495 [Clostridiaceae bacterium]|jgi:hypothetical protein|nr:GDSL-type esterase/lipase family protein [Bacillota bacterium]NLN51475.1 hypothetical protein [Clostridiaceae bacterium]